MRYKDIWFEEYERLCNEAGGVENLSEKTQDYLAGKAAGNINERLADAADYARMRAKGE